MTLSDIELLSKIFNDRKRRAVLLRQLSLLFVHGFNFLLHVSINIYLNSKAFGKKSEISQSILCMHRKS